MRIDDRKVNGHVLVDSIDSVDGFQILVESTGAKWVRGNLDLAPAVVAALLNRVLTDSAVLFARFYVIAADSTSKAVLQCPAYILALDTKTITIDIGTIVTGKKLDIALDTGAITLRGGTQDK